MGWEAVELSAGRYHMHMRRVRAERAARIHGTGKHKGRLRRAILGPAETANRKTRCRATHASGAVRKRRAFATTETELKLMAAAASMGFSRMPNSG